MKVGTILAASAVLGLPCLGLSNGASAQTFGDTRFPVCMQSYAPIQYIACEYPSVPACKADASGRGAICYLNPYYSPGQPIQRRRRSY